MLFFFTDEIDQSPKWPPMDSPFLGATGYTRSAPINIPPRLPRNVWDYQDRRFDDPWSTTCLDAFRDLELSTSPPSKIPWSTRWLDLPTRNSSFSSSLSGNTNTTLNPLTPPFKMPIESNLSTSPYW